MLKFMLKLKSNKFFFKGKLLSGSRIFGSINFLSKKKNFKISVLSGLIFSLFLIIGFLSYSVYLIFNFADTQKISSSMYSFNQSSAIYYNNGNNLYGSRFSPYIFGSFQHSSFFTFFVIAAVLSFIIVSLMFLFFYKLIIKQDNLELSLSSIEKNALEVPSLIFHEIKNNINALSINSKLLNSKLNNLDNDNNADNFENISEIKSVFVKIGNMIESETDKINLTMENIIKFSKSFKPDLEYVCLDSLINECINDIDLNYFNNNNIDINLNIDKQIILKLDPSLMKQVFLNLISNSINSYNGMPGSVYIYSSYYFSKAMIVIEDKGVGISKNNLKKIFEPFFTTRENGTGLGLAFVKKVIDSHGFSIDIDSQQDKGTKVSIILSCVLN